MNAERCQPRRAGPAGQAASKNESSLPTARSLSGSVLNRGPGRAA